MLEPMGGAINCAHRGASGCAPENTLSAIDKAIRQGADMAEIDVRPTADGKLVLFHDETLQRTSNGQGRVGEHTLTELRRLDAGGWYGSAWQGEIIPELGEVLTATRGRLQLNIELKGFDHNETALMELLRLLSRPEDADRCVVTSFDTELIDELKARVPEMRVGYILGPGEVPSWAFRLRIDLLSVERSLVDAAFMEFATASEKPVHVWTVDDPQDMIHYISLGVDAIITNHPDLFPRQG